MMACSDTQFSSSSQEKKSAPPVQSYQPKQTANQIPQPYSAETPQPQNNPKAEPEETVEEVQSRCWFAVSGVWLGVTDGNWPGMFPQVMGGSDIKHGARFDKYGGIFLEARDTPYVNNEGDGEINDAVTWTFDSIAVAPGMQVEIKDEKGQMVFQGEGPLIGQSSFYANTGTPYRTKLLSNSNIPEWMRKVAEEDQIKTIDLHSKLFGSAPGDAQSVLVKKVPGSTCDVSSRI